MEPVCDLKIESGDPSFGPDGEPLLLTDEAAVAQDVKHALQDRSLAVRLIAARPSEAETIRQQMKLLAREDKRLQPESVSVAAESAGGTLVRGVTPNNLPIAADV